MKCTITSLTCTYFLRYPLQVLKQVCQDTIPSVLDNKEQFCNSTAYKSIYECGGSHRAQSELKTPFTCALYHPKLWINGFTHCTYYTPQNGKTLVPSNVHNRTGQRKH